MSEASREGLGELTYLKSTASAANMPIFQINQNFKRSLDLKQLIDKNEKNLELVKKNVRRGDCGSGTISLWLSALDVYGDHSNWSEGESFLTWECASKERGLKSTG